MNGRDYTLPPGLWFPAYQPHRVITPTHAMTVVGALSEFGRRVRPPRVERRTFSVDHNTRVIALCSWQPDRNAAPTFVLLHGLTGHADAGYMRGTAAKVYASGFNVVRLNARNAGRTEAFTNTLHHTGLTDDLRAVLTELGAQDGLSPIDFGGFSMGANISLKLAGEWGDDAPDYVRAVAAVSPPLELAQASRAISGGGFNSVYEHNFLLGLRALVRRKALDHPARYDARGLSRVVTLREFDDRYIAPCFGFGGVDDYYHRASSARVLDRIRLPTLVVHARDDSLIPFDPFADWIARRPSNVVFVTPQRGGHIGFVSRRPARNEVWCDRDLFWAENRISQFLRWFERRQPA